MPDISMCGNRECPLREKCYRHPDSGTKPSPHWQAWTPFKWSDTAGCNDYWPTHDDKGKKVTP